MNIKVNIEKIIDRYIYINDGYYNAETGKIMEKKDIDKINNKNFIKLPKYDEKEQNKIINSFLSNLKNEKLVKEFKDNYDIKNFENYMSCFHWFAEDYGIWGDFIDYRIEEQRKTITKWCEEHNLEYY